MTDKTIYDRLIDASANFGSPKKNATNPHFKSKYADLQEIIECVRQPLLDAGLTFSQQIFTTGSEAYPITLRTIITDGKTSEVLAEFPVSGGTPQAIGSAITYAKRYSLAAAFGLAADEDDDGNAANKPSFKADKPKLEALRKATSEYLKANPDWSGTSVKTFIEETIGCPIDKMDAAQIRGAIALLETPAVLDHDIEF